MPGLLLTTTTSATTGLSSAVPSKFKKYFLVPDKEHYHHDGDVVILAKDVVFKVHRSKLLKEHSSLTRRLSEAPRTNMVTTSAPVGVSPSEMRWFLRVLYWSPAEFQSRMSGRKETNTTFPLAIVNVADIYMFDGIKHWALSLINKKYKEDPILRVLFFQNCSIPTLEFLLQLSQCSDSYMYIDVFAQDRYLELVRERSYPVDEALSFAEKNGCMELAGHIYYQQVVHLPNYHEDEDACDEHSFKRIIILAQGRSTLDRFWDKIRIQDVRSVQGAVRIEKSDHCRRMCEAAWERWAEVASKIIGSRIVRYLDFEHLIEATEEVVEVDRQNCCDECKKQLGNMWGHFRGQIPRFMGWKPKACS